MGLRHWICAYLWEKAPEGRFGRLSINTNKKELGGRLPPGPPLGRRGEIVVDMGKETPHLPYGKVLNARLILPDPLLGHGVARIPVTSIQKFRAEMEFAGSCGLHVRTEFLQMDRTINQLHGISSPKGDIISANGICEILGNSWAPNGSALLRKHSSAILLRILYMGIASLKGVVIPPSSRGYSLDRAGCNSNDFPCS